MTNSVRMAHLSDIHFGPAALAEVQRCADAALERIAAESPNAVLISGDLFDHRLDAHAPAFRAAVQWIQKLANCAPVLVLQGTFSHDVPGTLDILSALHARFSVAVATEESTWALGLRGWERTAQPQSDHSLAVFAWPPINRGLLAATGDVNVAYRAYASDVLQRAQVFAAHARTMSIPTVLTSHGTVNGCVTENGQTLVSPDHELAIGELFETGYDVVALGHIHKHQVWEKEGRYVAYAGSLARLHSGDYDPKGWIQWRFDSGVATLEFHTTPARDMIEFSFDGPPDMLKLQELASDCENAIVRIRYTVDAEQSGSVDRKAISALFANAAACKVEGTIVPRLTARAPHIAATSGAPAKLAIWADTQEVPSSQVDALTRCLQELLANPSEDEIATSILTRIDSLTMEQTPNETSSSNVVGV